MKKTILFRMLAIFACGIFLSCATVPEDAGFSDVKNIVDDRLDYRLHWNKGSQPDQEVTHAIDQLLAEKLTVDGAVQIALLNNADLQAVYEDLGVTQADVVEAGLLENPTLFGQARFPEGGDGSTNLEFEIAQNFLSLLMLPARKRLAAIQFEQKKLHVADAVLQMASEVSRAYYIAVDANTARDLQKQKTVAAENAFELAFRMKAAGNISDLDLVEHQAHYEQTRIDLAAHEEAVLKSREKLTHLMGLWGDRTEWRLVDKLPEIPDLEMPFDHLESVAVGNRLDLEAARKEVEAMAEALDITVDWRWVGDIEVGISTERDTDRSWVTGPSLSIQLPIFNQHQADIARLEAKLRQSHQRLTAQAVRIRSEVRTLAYRLVMKRQLIEHYEKTLLPLKKRIVELTLQNYNFMLMGTFDLLKAKQNEIETYQHYNAALKDYWVTRSELRRAIGGSLTETNKASGKHAEAPAPDDISELQ